MKLKPILIVFAVVAVAIVGLTIGITQSKSFEVTHHPEVKQEVTKAADIPLVPLRFTK